MSILSPISPRQPEICTQHRFSNMMIFCFAFIILGAGVNALVMMVARRTAKIDPLKPSLDRQNLDFWLSQCEELHELATREYHAGNKEGFYRLARSYAL